MPNQDWQAGQSLKGLVQVVYGTVTYSTASIATGVEIGSIPANSIVLDVVVKVATAFNAGTTNVLKVGKTGTLGAYADTSHVDETSATSQRVVAGLGDISTADVPILVSYTQTGTAASTGAAAVWLTYVNLAGSLGTA